MPEEAQGIDTMIGSLERSLKSQEEACRVQGGSSVGSPLQMAGFLHNALNKLAIPGLNIETLFLGIYEISKNAIGGIQKDIRRDPQKFILKIGVGALVLGAAFKFIIREKVVTRKEGV